MAFSSTASFLSIGACMAAVCAVLALPALAQADGAPPSAPLSPPAPTLSAQHSLTGTLHPAGQRIDLQVPAGHVVQLRVDGDNLLVDLRDAQGRHLRRLAQPDRGVQTPLWRSRGNAHEQLWLSPAQAGQPARFSLSVARTWSSAGPAPLPAEVSPLSPRLQALQRTLAQGGNTEAFWRAAQRTGTPLVEPWAHGQQLVTFVWRDLGNTNVRLFGSPSGDHNPLQKMAGGDVWWTSVVMDPRARLSYGLAPDVPQLGPAHASQQRRMVLATLQRDPLNLLPFPAPAAGAFDDDAFAGRSTVALAQAPRQPWVAARAGVAQGQLTRHSVHSAVLGNDRDVWTYVPAGADPQALLVLFDAHAFVHDVPTPRILDNLVADGLLPPVAAVIVGNASPEARGRELPPHPQFARFMAEELMPWVTTQGLAQHAHRTVVAGSSFGGLASAYLGLMHPELFGRVLSLSGSYWWAPEGERPGWMQRAWQMAPSPAPAVRFYLDAGLYERGRGGRAGILETNRELAAVLRDRGVAVVHEEFVSGHDYLHWQGALGCGLVALLAPARYAERTDPRLHGCRGVAAR